MRVGIYKSRRSVEQSKKFLEHIKKRCKAQEFEIVEILPVEHTQEDEFNQIVEALHCGRIDLGLIDGARYIKGVYSGEVAGIQAAGCGKRMNPANVLVTKRKHRKNRQSEIPKKPVMVALNETDQKQTEMINEGVACDYVVHSPNKAVKMIMEELCDGAVIQAYEAKRLNLSRYRRFKVSDYECTSFVPVTGQGILTGVIRENQEDLMHLLEHASHSESLMEYSIEQTVVSKIMGQINTFLMENCNYEITTSKLCVNAKIERGTLSIALFVHLYGKQSIRLVVKGAIEEKNRIIYELMDQMEKKIGYY